MSRQKISVVYLITDTITNLKYIGSKRHWPTTKRYFGSLSSTKRKFDIQRQWKADTVSRPDTFITEFLFSCNYEDITVQELVLIEREFHEKYDVVKSKDFVNAAMANKGWHGHDIGHGFPAKALETAANNKKQNGLSAQHRIAIGIGQTGRILTTETKNKISNAHKGMKHTKETKQKISETKIAINNKLSEAHKKKISLSLLSDTENIRGKKSGFSRTGLRLSDAHKNSIQAGHLKRRIKKFNNTSLTFQFEKIQSITKLSNFDDEYVYDISMPQDNTIKEDVQTFICNDILIHNSNYLDFGLVFESLGLNAKKVNIRQAVDFITYFMKNKMDPMYDLVLKSTIARRNGVSTMQFEFEAIGGFGIFLAKKKYCYAMLTKDGKYVADKKLLKATGIELAQRSAPLHVRGIIKTFVNTIFVSKGDISSQTFFGMCKSVKDRLQDCSPADLSKTVGIKTYSAYVINDKDKIELRMKCPYAVKGAARYNQAVFKAGLQATYPYLKDGMKGKVYYDDKGQPFCYPNEIDFPAEIAPPMSVDVQLDKLIFNPVKRMVSGLIDGDLSGMGSSKVQQGFSSMFNTKK